MVKKSLLLGICLLLIVSLLGVLHTPALAAADPIITLNPTEGLPPINVAVSGSGFASNSTITVTWNGTVIATVPETVETDTTGNFSCEITVSNTTVPQTAYGEYLVAAADAEGNSAGATFFVLPSTGEKAMAGISALWNDMIAVPTIISDIVSNFYDTGHLRLTGRGSQFVADMVTVLSDGARYAAQWLEQKLGG